MVSKIIVVGSGAREYAIIKKLRKDYNKLKLTQKLEIICLMTNKNNMIHQYCDEIFDAKLLSPSFIIDKIISDLKYNPLNKILFAIIGPEKYLQDGMSNLFLHHNIPCIGPHSLYAQIETSKSFCRDFLKDIGLSDHIPNYKIIENFELKKLENYRNEKIVIKNDGLCGGKGVLVQDVNFKTIDDINYDIIQKNSKVVIEEKLVGEEFSLMSLTDGYGNIRHFPPIQDYKKLYDNDEGPNTGSMGCLIDKDNTLPFLNSKDIETAQIINNQVIGELNKHRECNNLNIGYCGILYGSFMKTSDGIMVIEYNARFGDPECIIALELLKTNFFLLCQEIAQGKLISKLDFSKNACMCVYLVPKGYSEKTINDDKFDIYFNNKDDINSNKIFYSNIHKTTNHIYSLSSRTIAIIETDDSLYKCYHKIYNFIKNIKGNLFFRKDIGKKYLSNYEFFGVSIKESYDSLSMIKKNILSTYNSNVISEFGSFGGEYKIDNNILVSSIDGVGTKVVLAKKFRGEEGFKNLGKDIVGHSINDILVQGAFPLFFLDYFGTNCLNKNELNYFIEGVSEKCREYGNFPILGGETAEMPLVYNNNSTDLVGCIIGIKNTDFFKNPVMKGDIIINIHSHGPHTNGFTLINNILDDNVEENIINTLLTPHKCYLNEVKEFIDIFGYESLHAMCHITGGGIYDNIDRIITKESNLNYDIDVNSDKYPYWCKYLMEKGNISEKEMLNVFNCGFGFLLIVDKNIKENLIELSYDFNIIGNVY
jgi:phosphoribosylamine--glycine ligase / phosphoribosylformylglycinamidine cyclo-ligase